MTRAATVRVPASTSNLGGGFDTLGIAVRRYLSARFEPGGEGLTLRREGTLAGLGVAPADDLLLSAFVSELARRGVDGPRGELVVHSEIAVGRGLGTSAAAVVGGLMLGAAVAGDSAPDRGALLTEAARIEGHADNAAPALFGGLVAVAAKDGGGVRVLPFPLSPELALVFAAPPVPVSTVDARRVLPESYSRATAVGALGRLAALLFGLAGADAEALALGMQDALHVPYRLTLVPGGGAAMDAAREAGAWAATLSGSGSGVIAFCPHGQVEGVAQAMATAFRAATDGEGETIAFPLEPDRQGARLVPGS